MIDVVCAILQNKSKEVLIAKRSKGIHKDKWEFVGGKVKNGESFEQALVREIKEELNIEIKVNKHLLSTQHSYSDIKVNLHSYFAEITSGTIQLTQHKVCNWVSPKEILNYDLLEADISIAQAIIKHKTLIDNS